MENDWGSNTDASVLVKNNRAEGAQKDVCFQDCSELQVTRTTSPLACPSPWLASKLQQGASWCRGRITWKSEFCLAAEGKWTHWSVANVMRTHQLPVVSEEDDSFMVCSSRGNFSSPWRIAITFDMFSSLYLLQLSPLPLIMSEPLLFFPLTPEINGVTLVTHVKLTSLSVSWSYLTATVWAIFLSCLCKLCFKSHCGTLSSFRQRSLNSNQRNKQIWMFFVPGTSECF